VPRLWIVAKLSNCVAHCICRFSCSMCANNLGRPRMSNCIPLHEYTVCIALLLCSATRHVEATKREQHSQEKSTSRGPQHIIHIARTRPFRAITNHKLLKRICGLNTHSKISSHNKVCPSSPTTTIHLFTDLNAVGRKTSGIALRGRERKTIHGEENNPQQAAEAEPRCSICRLHYH
jgi:hypothetical protein